MARTDSGRTQRCAACNNPFVTFGGMAWDPPAVTVIERDGKLYHPECVQCKACGRAISSSYVPDKSGNIYHEGCFKRKYGLNCDCCHKRIASVVCCPFPPPAELPCLFLRDKSHQKYHHSCDSPHGPMSAGSKGHGCAGGPG